MPLPKALRHSPGIDIGWLRETPTLAVAACRYWFADLGPRTKDGPGTKGRTKY
jgi:hypothetical protein